MVMKQGKLLEIQVSEAQMHGEKFAEMEREIKEKKEQLKTQGERVMLAMRDSGSSFLEFRDEWGVKHEFEVSAPGLKLKHKQTGSPVQFERASR